MEQGEARAIPLCQHEKGVEGKLGKVHGADLCRAKLRFRMLRTCAATTGIRRCSRPLASTSPASPLRYADLKGYTMSNGLDASRTPWTFTERALRWVIFLGASGFVVYLCLRILGPFMNVIAWASILALTFHPLHVYLTRKTGRKALSAAI